jgi:hypothetical protein
MNLNFYLTKDLGHCGGRVRPLPGPDDVGQVPGAELHEDEELVALAGGSAEWIFIVIGTLRGRWYGLKKIYIRVALVA